MLSDESSSDSETGRFKCRSNTEDEQKKNSNIKGDSSRHSGKNRPPESDRYRREFDRKRNERDHFDRHTRDRHRYSRYSPISRRKNSRDRSPDRRSHDRHRYRDSRARSKPRDHRSSSRDMHKHSASQSKKSPNRSKDFKEEIRRNIASKDDRREKQPEPSEKKKRELPKEKLSLSPDQRAKRSEVHRPSPIKTNKNKSESPIIVEHSDESEEVQPGSYYSMIPAIVKEKSEESSEIDSSDDEKLRAKLLNLENELQKTRKKKHKKKHKRKSSKSSKDREQEPTTSVEVSSTTDIQSKIKDEEPSNVSEIPEVSSTQKSSQKESCEEGEISSDDETDNNYDIDPNDLRHKLKRSVPKTGLTGGKSAAGVCGPALPPHLKEHYSRSSSEIEGPALPPHLKKGSRSLGPSIPDNMRKVLAENECEVIKDDTSDEDIGIGPLPVGAEEKWSEAHKKLEERALDIKIKQLDGHSLRGDKVKSREQWMLELPEGKAKYLGLEARSFRSKEGPDMSDRSSWTDTPEEKARKESGLVKEEDADIALQKEAKARQIANRDEEQETAVKKHKKKHKREESLLDMHQKKLKKKKKKDDKEDGKKERRPFSRDVDLQVNRFDDAQKKSIIKKSQELNTRFSRGEAKYL
ncbi:uncharacterized protein ACR2FA_012096 [Aphomia sociella]